MAIFSDLFPASHRDRGDDFSGHDDTSGRGRHGDHGDHDHGHGHGDHGDHGDHGGYGGY